MSRLKQVLTSYTAAPPVMGGQKRESTRNPAWLAEELRRVSNTSRVYFLLCFAAVLCLLVMVCGIALFFLDKPKTITAVFSALGGISVSGLTLQMANLWKQKVASDLLIIVTGVANEQQMSEIIDKLLAKL